MGKSFITTLKNACICLLIVLSYSNMLSGCANEQGNTKASSNEQIQNSETQTETNRNRATQNSTRDNIDLSNIFDGINGCAVIFHPQENQYSFYNETMCEQEVSPYSTFKIISTLMGLQNGVITDEASTMNYNGTQYPVSEWNKNLTLQEAFQASCIWYFRQIIDAVGQDEVKKELDSLPYGNCDISEWSGSNTNPFKELNGFWLNSSLKISPLEQVQILSKIFEGQSSYSEKDIEILKNIMLVKDDDTRKIYGKTGSGSAEAWFVGFAEEGGEREYFVVYLNDSEQKETLSGSTAKEIALEMLK